MKSKKLKSGSLGKVNKKSQGMYERICKIIEDARGNIVRAVNTEMVIAYCTLEKKLLRRSKGGNLGLIMVKLS